MSNDIIADEVVSVFNFNVVDLLGREVLYFDNFVPNRFAAVINRDLLTFADVFHLYPLTA